jgi:leucyl-tRNA synthetase
MQRYNPNDIEPKWQKIWDDQQTYKANLSSSKPKYIAMSMFNYPSGAGIHIGHAMNYTISDVMARYKRQQGYESYHPVGWDAFGLPAENFAIKTGVSPQVSMAKIIPDYHTQYKAMGWSNDWSKEIATHQPAYYKWTQWLFSQMYKNGLAYQDARMQWWCTKCQTVLANEQVIDGKCWRHDSKDDPLVEKKEVKQWFFKITDYADELLEATDALDWSEVVKTAQKNWIGKSKGAEITFRVESEKSKVESQDGQSITVFTTRPDTLFGATFLVLAPELELIDEIVTDEQREIVSNYIKESTKKSEIERQASKEKTGVFTGAYVVNPGNNEKIPVWVADYVLAGYGTGAIMAVPAHDQRDNEFAKVYNLPIVNVIDPVAIREDAMDKVTDVKKNKIVAVVTNDKDQLLTINWGKLGGRLFVGGTEEGEEISETTALREVTEETGYTDLEVEEVGDETFHYKYFAFSKQETHETDVKFVKIKLLSEARKEQQLDDSEKNNFSVEWVSRKQADVEITEPLHRYGFDKFIAGECFHGEGIMNHSGEYDGMSSSEAREKIVADLELNKTATEKTIYKLRDWSVTRQRYWGAPTPIIHCEKCGPVLVPDDQLPVILPELEDFQPSGDGRSALARATDWLQVDCPQCGGKGERETDTLDTYICSSWYMFRYFDPTNESAIFDSTIVNKWMPIDFYNGGDHATAHMIYARFITRFLNKIGLVDNPEPFKKFLFNGKVTAADGQMFSKSKGNGVDPLEIINSGYGADALRTYLMFAAPLDLWMRWDPRGVPGTHRFINRVWNLVQEFQGSDKNSDESATVLRVIHPAIRKVTEDLEDQKYNTAIAAMMKATNDLYELKAKEGFAAGASWQFALESLVMLMAPFAPHASEELWHALEHTDSVHIDHWPMWDETYLIDDTITIVVQVNGKLRAQLQLPSDVDEAAAVQAARSNEKVAGYLTSEPKKTIYIPGKLISFVV